MSVIAKTVTGRRELSFSSLDEIVADAEKLAASAQTKTLGNWSLGHLFEHLALTVDQSIDGFPMKAPWFVRLIGPLIKSSVMKKMKPGINLPKETIAAAFPNPSSQESALEHLRSAVARTKNERMTAPHPAFGKMTHDEWTRLHCRHAEMHLSFARPKE